jgi:hypothetical protein
VCLCVCIARAIKKIWSVTKKYGQPVKKIWSSQLPTWQPCPYLQFIRVEMSMSVCFGQAASCGAQCGAWLGGVRHTEYGPWVVHHARWGELLVGVPSVQHAHAKRTISGNRPSCHQQTYVCKGKRDARYRAVPA